MIINIFGTKIKISYFAATAVCLMLYTDKTGLFIPMLSAVILHEFAHLLLLNHYGYKTKCISVEPAGIRITKGVLMRTRDEMAVLIAGPFSNIAAFAILYLIGANMKSNLLLKYSAVQLLYGIINILPSKNLDGGSVLDLLLTNKIGHLKSELILDITTVIVSLLIIALGVYVLIISGNPSLIVFSLYLIILSMLNFS